MMETTLIAQWASMMDVVLVVGKEALKAVLLVFWSVQLMDER